MNINLLIVDDMHINIEVLEMELKNIELVKNIYTATNGKDAYDIILKNPIDLVLTDYEMPKMNGIELIKKVLDTKTINKIPEFYILTGNYNKVRQELQKLGDYTIFNKPTKYDILKDTIIEEFNKIEHTNISFEDLQDKKDEKLENILNKKDKKIIKKLNKAKKTNKIQLLNKSIIFNKSKGVEITYEFINPNGEIIYKKRNYFSK